MKLLLNKKDFLRFFIFITLFLVLIFFATYTSLPQYISPEKLKYYLSISGYYAPVIFIFAFITGLLLKIPGIFFVILGAIVFKKIPAIVYSYIAIIIGTSIIFFLSRFLLRDAVSNMELKGIKILDKKIVQNGFLSVLMLRLIFFLMPPVNWVLGITGVRYRDYLFGTVLGVMPGILIFSLVFSDIDKFCHTIESHDFSHLSITLIGLVFLLLFFLMRRFLKNWFE